MKSINIIKQNLQCICTTWLKSLGILSAILSFVFLFASWDDFGVESLCHKLRILILLCVVFLVGTVLWVCILKRKKIVWRGASGKIIVRYGDLLKQSFIKNKNNHSLYVIPVNTTFDTIVDEDISLCEKPLVSPKTLHGRWIKKMINQGINIEEIDDAIRVCLKKQKKEPRETLSIDVKERGKREVYELGTVAIVRGKRSTFLLLALSEFDENNNAQASVEDLENVIKSLIFYYDQHGQGYEIWVPLMGTNLSRAGLSHSDSLRIITALFRLYGDKIHGDVNVVIYDGDKDKVTIDI